MTDVHVVDDDKQREDAFAVRQTVFVEEQGVDEDLEYDEHDDPDADAVHFVAYAGGQPVGAARLREYETDDGDVVGKVERVAVLESHREAGVGRELMCATEEAARERGFEAIKLHAQTRVEGFYRSLGYESRGEEFDEAGIPHIEMRKSLE
ncbi:GNAT family N-acetyltransferase [Halopiger aswanensis]|uniref:Putative GNAT family N-acyltransferase n=1 Tax=Halopiger aswanensis TaxID=148449 RepID=A0A3R7HW48_9EURY|nr:GNAT family N-acetyltransferase [Halopiger aswanensis]RKD93277.1 putative GNAT family N-acyltransferase [Halopiger aswanensis]